MHVNGIELLLYGFAAASVFGIAIAGPLVSASRDSLQRHDATASQSPTWLSTPTESCSTESKASNQGGFKQSYTAPTLRKHVTTTPKLVPFRRKNVGASKPPSLNMTTVETFHWASQRSGT